jgi:hypothetical protein
MIMHWRNRKRRGEGAKGQKDFAAKVTKQYASRLMYNRWHMLCPFPLEKIDIYNALFSVEQHRAFDLLKRTVPSALSMGTKFNMTFDMDVNVTVMGCRPRPQWFVVDLDCEVPMPDTATWNGTPEHVFLVSQLPPHLREPIVEWGARWLTASRETKEVCGKLDKLFDICNTMGQIKRLWPNACNLLPEAAQAKLREAKVKSPYPDAVLEVAYRDDGKEIALLSDEWKPEKLDWYDDRLTEALCLPMTNPAEGFSVQIEYGL